MLAVTGQKRHKVPASRHCSKLPLIFLLLLLLLTGFCLCFSCSAADCVFPGFSLTPRSGFNCRGARDYRSGRVGSARFLGLTPAFFFCLFACLTGQPNLRKTYCNFRRKCKLRACNFTISNHTFGKLGKSRQFYTLDYAGNHVAARDYLVMKREKKNDSFIYCIKNMKKETMLDGGEREKITVL